MIITDKNKLITGDIERVQPDEVAELIAELEKELKNSVVPGIGIASTQIGIKKAVAIVRILDEKTGQLIKINLINPVLISGEDLSIQIEGCLSFPGESAKTIRFSQIVIETDDDYNQYATNISNIRYDFISRSEKDNGRRLLSLEGLSAICAQHEMAHLHNLVMTDFEPKEVGRNEECFCGSKKKNKKCHAITHWNINNNKLFKPNYK